MRCHSPGTNLEVEGLLTEQGVKGLQLRWAAGGVALTLAVALLGMGMAYLPYIGLPGPMLLAIGLAVMYRQCAGYPVKLQTGIDFSTKKLLRLAIILYGFKLNMQLVLGEGAGLLLKGAIVIGIAFGVTLTIARWIKADRAMSLLLAAGTGICGAAAIAAVSPLIGAKEEDTAVSVGVIALTGTVFALIYALVFQLASFDPLHYGIWTGLSLHEIAHVAAASSPGGESALGMALLAKLGRVLMLIPICFLIAFWMNRKNGKGSGQVQVAFPWFLLGFILSSLIGTYMPVHPAVMKTLSMISTMMLTMAMVGLGLNVRFQTIRTKAWRPAASMLMASIVIAVVTYFMR